MITVCYWLVGQLLLILCCFRWWLLIVLYLLCMFLVYYTVVVIWLMVLFCISLRFGDCGGRMVYLSDWCFAVRCVACVLVV